MSDRTITVYSTRTCGDCILARTVLDELGVEYRELDVHDDAARERVLELNGGFCTVPTLIFPSGRVLVEPTAAALVDALVEEGLSAA